MIKFSLTVPTRKRVDLFENLCKSIQNNTCNLHEIELLAIIDNDDRSKYKEIFPWVKILKRPRGNNMSRDYHTWAYLQSTGKYIWTLNDDCEIWTKNWDVIAYNFLNSYREADQILYGRTQSQGQKNKEGNDIVPFSFFPIISRKGIEVLGHVMSPLFPGWEADNHIYHVYKSVKRVVPIDIFIFHIQGKHIKDESHYKMKTMTPTDNLDNFVEKVKNDACKLQDYIKNVNKIFI